MKYTIGHMQNKNRQIKLSTFFELLRWNKPTGRMILLIPAGWSLYLTPDANPTFLMLLRIILGGLLVSGLGCVVNDIWDKKIDQRVVRKLVLSEFKDSLFKKSFLSLTAPILELVRAIASFLSASISSVEPPPISIIT